MLTEFPPVRPDGPNARSQAGQAYESIRGDILSGRHQPNKKLRIQELAAELGVSPGAIREALSRLVPEQLVVSREQRGFAVAPLSIADLEDLTDLRCEIEAVALRRSVQRGDLDWEVNLIAASHRLQATPIMDPVRKGAVADAWRRAHEAYHAALIAAAGSPRLLQFHAQLYEQSERYRGLTAHLEGERDIPGEHAEIVQLALARDADRLVEATVAHIRQTTRLIIGAAQQRDAVEDLEAL